MPNWCSQDLYITGSKKERDRFVKAVTVREVDEGGIGPEYGILNGVFPMPEDFIGIHSGCWFVDGVKITEWREIDGKSVPLSEEERNNLMLLYGAANWYDWAHSNWGTKWGDCETSLVDHSDRRTLFTFESAWSPITKGLLKVSSEFPTLRFKLNYFEQGMGFRGTDIVKNGECIDGKYFENYRGGRGG